MADEPFRSLLSTGWMVLLPIILVYRVRSQLTREPLDRRQEGIPMLVALRLVGLVNAAGVIAYLSDPAWMAWSSIGLPRWLRWSGMVLGAAAAVTLVWTLHTLGRNLTDTVVTRRAHTLVVIGPYRWVRHPFYAGVATCLFGTAIASANWFHMAGALALLVMFRLRVPVEEAKLHERFGAAYRDHRARTGRFLPRVGS
jgi:protein-S-isoprenylcysteine O-methyltransferase Ste14